MVSMQVSKNENDKREETNRRNRRIINFSIVARSYTTSLSINPNPLHQINSCAVNSATVDVRGRRAGELRPFEQLPRLTETDRMANGVMH